MRIEHPDALAGGEGARDIWLLIVNGHYHYVLPRETMRLLPSVIGDSFQLMPGGAAVI